LLSENLQLDRFLDERRVREERLLHKPLQMLLMKLSFRSRTRSPELDMRDLDSNNHELRETVKFSIFAPK
jgi:hypothetical protein